MNDDPILHVYTQIYPHSGLTIVGNRTGLLKVIKAATDALLYGHSDGEESDLFCADGEGYSFEVRLENDAAMDSYVSPYSVEESQGEHEAAAKAGTWPKKAPTTKTMEKDQA